MPNSPTPPYPGFRPYAIPGSPPYQQSQFPGQQLPHPSSQLPPGHEYRFPAQGYDQQQRQGKEFPSSSREDSQGQEYSSSSQQHSHTQGQQNPTSSQQYPQRQVYFSPGQQYSQGQQYPSSVQQYPQGQSYSPPGYQHPQGQTYFSPSYQHPYGQQYPPPSQQYPLEQLPASANSTPMVRPGIRDDANAANEPELEGWTGFDDKDVRRVFVRKVYSILMVQLLFTLGIIALFSFEPNVKRFVRQNRYLYFIALAVFVAVYLGLACFQSLRRKYPINIIMLTIFTLSMSFMLGTISSHHRTDAVFMAVGICAAVCLFVSIFSFYTKFDFTSCGGILCILLLVLILFGLIAIFIPSKVMTMIYAATGAVVFTLFLAYDTQMMMGGKNYELSPEEHIFAAVQIYIDIVYIFMFLLMLIGGNE